MAQISRLLQTAVIRLRSAAGAIDLASIMVGVLVMGILGSLIAAAVFVVIPWSQDAAARSSLDGVKTAQSVSQVKDGKYQNWAGLLASKYVTGPAFSVDTVVNAAGDCWVGAAKSGSGTSFYKTSRDNTVLDDKNGPPDTNWCVSSTRALADPVINLATNPSFEIAGAAANAQRNLFNTVQWSLQGGSQVAGVSALGVSWTRETSAAGSGDTLRSFADVTDLVPGQFYTGQIELYNDSAVSVDGEIDWCDNGNLNFTLAPGERRIVSTGSAIATYDNVYRFFDLAVLQNNRTVLYRNVMIQPTTETRTYFDGSTAAGSELTYAWTGAPSGSSSAQRVIAPSGSTGTNQNSATQSAVWASTGTKSVRMTPFTTTSQDTYVAVEGDYGTGLRLGMQAGHFYTAVAKARLGAAQTGPLASIARGIVANTKVGAAWYVATNSAPAPNAAGTTELRLNFAVPAGATEAFVRLYNGAQAGGGDVFYDDFMLVEIPDLAHPYTGPYFDGSSVNGVWNGTANASTSTGWIRR